MLTSDRPSAHVGKCKVLIVDDHPIIRQGLAGVLGQEPDIDVSDGGDNVAEAIMLVKSLQPDIVVVDISLKNGSGIDLITQINRYDKRIKTVVWSAFDETVYADRAIQAGAMGYVNKQASVDVLVSAIRRVFRGEVCLSPLMANRLLHRFGRGRSPEQDPIASLSPREVEVFRLLGRGVATPQMAQQLGISPRTVEAHREKIKAKLNLKNAAALNCRAVQWMLENG